MKLTDTGIKVIRPLLDNPGKKKTGYELRKESGVGNSTVYATLHRLEKLKLLKRTYEKADPRELGRPLRVYYEITGLGQRAWEDKQREYRKFLGLPES